MGPWVVLGAPSTWWWGTTARGLEPVSFHVPFVNTRSPKPSLSPQLWPFACISFSPRISRLRTTPAIDTPFIINACRASLLRPSTLPLMYDHGGRQTSEWPPGEWHAAAKAHSINDDTIHTTGQKSASNIELRQFLLLRVLYPAACYAGVFRKRCLKEEWVKPENLAAATASLKQLECWKIYMDSITLGKKDEPGTFALARWYQRRSAQDEAPAAGWTCRNSHPVERRRGLGCIPDIAGGL